MDCKEAEELFVPFVLGAIDDRERRLVDSHLESCGACSVALYGETVAGFALELPQLEAPPQVKQRLFKRVERDGWRAWRLVSWRRSEHLLTVSVRHSCPTWVRLLHPCLS